MFAEMAAEQPDVQLPTEDQIGAVYRSRRTKTRGMGVARDIGFRMPSVGLAEGHMASATVYLYRFDRSTLMLMAKAICDTLPNAFHSIRGHCSTGTYALT